MKTIELILRKKTAAVYSIMPDTSVLDALQLMMEKNISALLVIENEALKGIFTERDYARKIILHGKSSRNTPVGEVMTSHPKTIATDEKIESCMEMMTNHHFRHLPVVEGGKVVGMISIGDLVKYIIEDQKQTIDHLQSYIHS